MGVNDDRTAVTGVCIWLTGPGGAGKSTLTGELVTRLEAAGRTVTVLDVVPELRKLPCERTSRGKLIRKAFVAREVVRHGGIAVCVTISSRREVREEARHMVGADRFVEVFVDAPDEVTASRKAARPKRPALSKRIRRSAKATLRRLGLAEGGRGFEAPENPDVHVDTTLMTPTDGARRVIAVLQARGTLVPDGPERSG